MSEVGKRTAPETSKPSVKGCASLALPCENLLVHPEATEILRGCLKGTNVTRLGTRG